MITLIPYAVRNSVGVVIRTGHCQPQDLPLQAHDGETVAAGTPADFAANAARCRAAMDQARSFRIYAEPTESELVIEVLKKRHSLTADDLAAARQEVVARRQGSGDTKA